MFNRRIGLVQALTNALVLSIPKFRSGVVEHKAAPNKLPKLKNGRLDGRVSASSLSTRRRWLTRWSRVGGGQKECARRRHQIAAGTLNTSNGLVPFGHAG